jgi:chitin disaccharide deacetylase
VGKQLAAFRQLTGRDPTHLDSHQHVHDNDPSATIVRALADDLGIPLRNHGTRIRHRGDLYGRGAAGEILPHAITVENLIDILRDLEPGITELNCHPGKGNDLDSDYGEEREEEVQVLCDPRVRDAIAREGILLCNFADIAGV